MAQTVATPILNVPSESSTVQFNVTVTDSTAGTTLYYTLDGSTPTTSTATSVSSGGTISITKSETLNVIGGLSGYTSSAVASAAYEITGQVAGGFSHTISLKSDGTVWTWGLNSSGQLGDGTYTERNSPVQVSSLSGIVQVAAGSYHSLALKSDGTVYAWGLRSNGQIGDGSATGSNPDAPVHIASLDPVTTGGVTVKVIALSAGAYGSMALKSDGSVWTWGDNSDGEIGDGTTTARTSPVEVSFPTGVSATAIASGYYFNLVLTSTGSAYAWGYNTDGELGHGTTGQSTTPVTVNVPDSISPGTLSQICAGGYHSLALTTGGVVVGWGLNSKSQVGDGTTTSRSAPVTVLSSSSNVAEIAAGGYHSLLIKSDGTVLAWGCNDYGQVGNNSMVAASTPTVPTGISSVMALGAGDSHTLMVKTDGTVWMCGRNEYGQTGDNTADRLSPVQVTGISAVQSISESGDHLLAVTANGVLYSAGANEFGGLGLGSTTQQSGPMPVTVETTTVNSATVPVPVTAAGAGQYFSLALTSDQKLWSWGLNSVGQLGSGNTTQRNSPGTTPLLTGVIGMAAGPTYGVAIDSSNDLWAWGDNAHGDLGDGTTTQRTSPVAVTYGSGGSVSGIVAVSCGSYRAVALRNDGTVWAWGNNSSGQVGDGTTTQRTAAVEVVKDSAGDPLTGVSAISSGTSHCLALDSSGNVWAWGLNSNGQVGDNTYTNRSYAVQISGLSGMVAVGACGYASYALKSDGTVYAWGLNADGQLGLGSYTTLKVPTQITGLSGITALSGGAATALALKQDGSVEGWGNDSWGQMGTGPSYSVAGPIPGLNLLAGTPSPTVAISLPGNNATAALGTAFSFNSTASESGGSIGSVQYYLDSTLIGQSTTGSAYSLSWTPSTWGNYTFTAVATDSSGNTSYHSTPVTLQVPYDSDGDLLPDWWEWKYFQTLSYNASSDPDGSGYTLLQDYQYGADPTNPYDQPVLGSSPPTHGPGCLPPTFSSPSGTYYTGIPLSMYSNPLGITGVYYTTDGTTPTTSSTRVSAGGGFQLVAVAGTSVTVKAMAAISGSANSVVSSATYTFPSDLGLVPASHMIATPGAADGEIDLSWDNNANDATYIQVFQSTDGINWTVIATLSDPTQCSYAVKGLTIGTAYWFGVSPKN